MKPYGEGSFGWRLNHRGDPSLPDNDSRRYDWKWKSVFDDCYGRQKARKARREARQHKRAQRGHARQAAKMEIIRLLQELDRARL